MNEMKCHCCKKEIYTLTPTEWCYRKTNDLRVKYFCSWTCMRAYEKAEEEKAKGQTRRVKNLKTGEVYEHLTDLKNKTGVSRSKVLRNPDVWVFID